MTPETRDFLGDTMPGLCAELLTWRRAASDHPAALAMALRSAALEGQLERARHTALHAEEGTLGDLARACDIIRRLSPSPKEREAATDVLAEIHGHCA
ncbi:hypothetical protein KM176_05500 [Pseudooceanicola sp. CBS1P-1]|uniref:Uncharacterized protein n=1 Tax=Pseudooceanicola albus TaxID=2692189 RepID=A0A6L7FYJ5_9RHOB|nr:MULTISPECIES: hypothetical protein [Pseudooceanicola]MBT9383307.1 hypothetical protein [Pseudooceanicola endophyticus]MXN16370.1 hypothetical protein [Pseudooceanicola albus]